MRDAQGLTVFVPVFNEEALLSSNTRRLQEYLESLKIPYEIIIGSNGIFVGNSQDLRRNFIGPR